MLKKAGIKTSGKKSTLTKRAKKAHLIRGGFGPSNATFGSNEEAMPVQAGGAWSAEGNNSANTMESALPMGAQYTLTGGRRHGLKTKSLKKLLKKAGLKTSGKKAALTKRAKSAHLIRGGGVGSSNSAEQAGIVPGASGVWGVA
jgi:hypothetical protein